MWYSLYQRSALGHRDEIMNNQTTQPSQYDSKECHMATRNLVINDPSGIHARPAAMFTQAVTTSGQTVTIAKEGGNAVPAGSILSIMGLGIKQGDTVVLDVEGDNAEAVADDLAKILISAE